MLSKSTCTHTHTHTHTYVHTHVHTHTSFLSLAHLRGYVHEVAILVTHWIGHSRFLFKCSFSLDEVWL